MYIIDNRGVISLVRSLTGKLKVKGNRLKEEHG